MRRIAFTIDVALLRELGERLVGKPHIALAELIKNAYDADATAVELRMLKDRIEVSDNGHGMDEESFKYYWMRIGSPHKERQATSPKGRALTGQKGVGRLAVQFLGSRLVLTTKTRRNAKAIRTEIDWNALQKRGDLTSAEIEYGESVDFKAFPEGSSHGTHLTISKLSQSWSAKALKDLALEIWSLQPPFESVDEESRFRVTIVDAPDEHRREFESFVSAFQRLWHAKIKGELEPPGLPGDPGKCKITLLFEDGAKETYVHSLAPCPLKSLRYEIRIYSLVGRQRHGVAVAELRDYLRTFGGTRIYDSGFRLPFYGVASDWLRVQLDHSRRIHHSTLLPKRLQETRGLFDLPTNSRILGEVHVSTAAERAWVSRSDRKSHRPLEISITRDRLIENEAFEALVDSVRVSLDFYAVTEAARGAKHAQDSRSINEPEAAVQAAIKVVEEYAQNLPDKALSRIRKAIEEATTAIRSDTAIHAKQANLLGALATAGMAAVAFEHEFGRQLKGLDEMATRLDALAKRGGDERAELFASAKQIRTWISETRETHQIFTSLAERDSREVRDRLKASVVIAESIARLGPLLRGVSTDSSAVSTGLRLPQGTFVEWSALFQNILVNAANATLDCDERRIVISSKKVGLVRAILFEDTGVGVDLKHAETLFEPFSRRLKISPARRGLGVGGAGLGLTIVRMIATNLGCRVSFAKPSDAFSTSFRLAWSERL